MPTAVMTEDFQAPRADDILSPAGAPTGGDRFALLDPLSMLGAPNTLGTRALIEAELDVVALTIRSFHTRQPDQVMLLIAGISARLTELAIQLHRVEATDRQYTRIRTQQVERLLIEVDRQYKIASRLVEVMRQDIELSR